MLLNPSSLRKFAGMLESMMVTSFVPWILCFRIDRFALTKSIYQAKNKKWCARGTLFDALGVYVLFSP
jgi:hypothetical protein